MERTIKEYPNYGITSCGRVYSYKTNRWLKTYTANNGYQLVVFPDNKHLFVHRLVAEAFLDNPDALPVVNHKNGIRNDNRLSNLEWTTQQRNVALARGKAIEINGQHFNSISQAMRELHIAQKTVYQILERQRNEEALEVSEEELAE